MTPCKVTATAAVLAFGLGSMCGYKAHTTPLANAPMHVINTDQTAQRVVTTVTKYVTVTPGLKKVLRVPSSITTTIIDKPRNVTKETTHDSYVSAPLVPKYTMGIGCVLVNCRDLSRVQLQAGMRLADTNFWLIGTARTTSFALGVNYEF